MCFINVVLQNVKNKKNTCPLCPLTGRPCGSVPSIHEGKFSLKAIRAVPGDSAAINPSRCELVDLLLLWVRLDTKWRGENKNPRGGYNGSVLIFFLERKRINSASVRVLLCAQQDYIRRHNGSWYHPSSRHLVVVGRYLDQYVSITFVCECANNRLQREGVHGPEAPPPIVAGKFLQNTENWVKSCKFPIARENPDFSKSSKGGGVPSLPLPWKIPIPLRCKRLLAYAKGVVRSISSNALNEKYVL